MGGYSATLDLDLGEKVGKWDLGGGVFCNLGFGLREKSWKFGFLDNSETIPEPGMVSTVYFFAKYTLIIFPSKFT